MLAVVAGLAMAGVADGVAQDTPSVRIEVRVWQHVTDDRDIHISARPADGSWRTVGTIALPLDDGSSPTGRYRFGDIALDVPLGVRLNVTIEVRVWQDVRDGRNLYISARPADGSWSTLGTIPLPLDGGFSSDRTFRYGETALRVPLPSPSAEACSNGMAVPEPERNAGLVRDCRVLLEARDILAGSGSPPRWSSDRPIGEWTGVTLSSSPARVTEILLWGELKGRIPPNLGQLEELRSLQMHDSGLSGEIPSELGALLRLEQLNLSRNELTGRIPTGLASLSNLRTLKLGGNQLTGEIPTELRSLRNLSQLHLGGNRLNGEIPRELGTLPYLWSLTLGGNQLTGSIPAELGTIPALRSLSLSGNRLTGEIPPELGELTYLTHLDLGRNELTGAIPPELGALTNLIDLYLYNNRLTGEIPRSLDALPVLRRVSFVNNPLTGCISRALQSKLARLSRNDGSAIGQIDLPLCEVASVLAQLEPPLRNLTDGCSRDGAVPDPENNPGLVNDCAVLLEASESLAGAATPPNWSTDRPIGDWEGVELGGVPLRVTSLEVAADLRGRIPPGIARLSGLRRLDLAGNRLGGAIPAELGALVNLETLRLNGNQLTGEIPGELGHLTYLGELNLFGNRLTGEIPEEFSGLRNLAPGREYSRIEPLVLDLRRNRLTGGIPTAFAELAHEIRLSLYLAGNRLTGCIPLALGGGLIDRAELGLTYCQCPSALLFDDEYRPALTVGADGVPFMPQEANDLPGAYRLSSSLVTDIPPGGRYVRGELMRDDAGDIVVEIQELTSHSRLVMNALTGEELSRSVVESPTYCSVTASNLFDTIVGSARVQPLGLTRDPDGIHRLHVLQTVHGGRSYRIDGSNYLVVDAPAGMRLTLERVLYNTVLLRDEESGSLLTLDATTGSELSRDIVGGGDGERDVGGLFDGLAASVRERPAPPSCDNPATAPDCHALLEAEATFASSTSLNWSTFTPVESWQGVTVSRWSGRVVELDLFNSGLTGPLPLSLSQLSALEALNLSRNELTGGIPPELGLLTNLRELNLGENPLGGEIPPELGELTNLVELNLYTMALVGEIPEELGSLELLEDLTTYGNNLEGCIPEGLLRFDINIHGSSNPHLRRCDEGQ